MNLRNFRKLGRDDQLKMIKADGVLLLHCRGLRVAMKLYALYDYYIELCYGQDVSKLIMINAFDDVEGLEPYLAYIDISTLVH